MNKLTKTVLQRPVATVVCILALIIFGTSSVLGFDLELTPEMNMPMMAVITTYPNAGPEDVEKLISKEIEDGCGNLSGLKTISSTSQENMSMVMFEYEYGTDMDEAYIDMQEALERVKIELPDDAESPVVLTMDANSQPNMRLSVDSELDMDLRNYVENTLQPEFEKLSTVADVDVTGGTEAYISVELYSDYVNQYHLDMQTIASAIAQVNFTMPGGSAQSGDQELNVNTSSEYETPDELENVPITLSDGSIIRLADVADVHYASEKADSYSRYNGNDNITVALTKNQESSAVTLSKEVTKVVEQLNQSNENVKISVIYDSSETIMESLGSVAETLISSILLSMLVLFLFFGDFKGSFIVGSSMPISLLVTLILMKFMGFTLNMITMGALVIGIGMMVDNSIVVIEMCFRKKDEGMGFLDAAYEGTKVVLTSVVASTITTVVVYLPLSMLEGMSGQMFKPLGYTIIFSITASLFSAITLVPLCFSRYCPIEKKENPVNKILDKVSDRYGRLLGKALRKKKLVSLIAIGMFAVSIFLVQFIHTELMASTDEGQVGISISFKPGLRLEIMDEKVQEIEEYVAQDTEIESYSVTIEQSSGEATVTGYIKDDASMTTDEVVDAWGRDMVSYADDCEISVSSTSSMGMSGGGGANSVQIVLNGDDLDSLREGSDMVVDVMNGVSGVLNVDAELSDTVAKVEVDVDSLQVFHAGLSPQIVGSAVYMALSGNDAQDVTIDGQDYTIRVEYGDEMYDRINDLESLTFQNSQGIAIPLTEVADIIYTDTPLTISRKNGQYTTTITATVESEEKFAAQDSIKQAVGELRLPNGVEQGVNTMDEMMGEEFLAIGLAIAAAVFLVFMVMAIQFESIRYSLLIMFCIPFSLIGSFLLLVITGCTFSMTSLMGFLMLTGIVVNNGIIYVDTANQMRQSEKNLEVVLVEAGKSRLRPILMTTLTTVLGMLPLALGLGTNAAMMQGMSVVIIGGLSASTLLTLLLLPTFYMMVQKREKKGGKRRGKAAKEKTSRKIGMSKKERRT